MRKESPLHGEPVFACRVKDHAVNRAMLGMQAEKADLGARLSENVGVEGRRTVHCAGFTIEHWLGFRI
jgi:hypothetical protein